MEITIPHGSTSRSINVFIQDATKADGTGLTGLVFNSAGLTAYYARSQGSAAAITLATLAAANSAYSSGGFKEIDATNMPGLYRLDIPDAVLAIGVPRATVVLKGAASMIPVVVEIELDESPLRVGVAQAGAANTVTLDSGASASDDFYNGTIVQIVEGTGAGQYRLLYDYVGSTKVAAVYPAWVTNPASGSVFRIMAQGMADVELWHNVAPNGMAAGRIDVTVGAMQADVVTAAAIASAAIDADAIATDALGTLELAAGVTTEIANAAAAAVAALTATNLAAVPGATATWGDIVSFLHMLARNKQTVTSAEHKVFRDDASTVMATSALTDDGTTTTRGEFS